MILSVSGSPARKKTFFLPAKSVTARPMCERNVPVMHVDLLARHQLLGHAHGIAGVGVVVARDQFELAGPAAPPLALISSTASSQPFL